MSYSNGRRRDEYSYSQEGIPRDAVPLNSFSAESAEAARQNALLAQQQSRAKEAVKSTVKTNSDRVSPSAYFVELREKYISSQIASGSDRSRSQLEETFNKDFGELTYRARQGIKDAISSGVATEADLRKRLSADGIELRIDHEQKKVEYWTLGKGHTRIDGEYLSNDIDTEIEQKGFGYEHLAKNGVRFEPETKTFAERSQKEKAPAELSTANELLAQKINKVMATLPTSAVEFGERLAKEGVAFKVDVKSKQIYFHEIGKDKLVEGSSLSENLSCGAIAKHITRGEVAREQQKARTEVQTKINEVMRSGKGGIGPESANQFRDMLRSKGIELRVDRQNKELIFSPVGKPQVTIEGSSLGSDYSYEGLGDKLQDSVERHKIQEAVMGDLDKGRDQEMQRAAIAAAEQARRAEMERTRGI